MTRNETIQTMPYSAREGWRPGAVHLRLGVALGLGVLLAALFLLSASGPQARAGLAAGVAEDAVSQSAAWSARHAATAAPIWHPPMDVGCSIGPSRSCTGCGKA